MTNGTRHDPCIPRHWAMRCPAWTSTRTSHNRVVNKIRPNTDVASISSVLHLVWPLAQSLSSMVVPTRSRNSSWRSLWDLQGTQAPQLRQSNNTLGGTRWKTLDHSVKCQFIESSTGRNINWSYSIYLVIYGNTNSHSLQISLKMNLTMDEVVFDKNTNTTMSLNITFIISWIMFKCWCMFWFKHSFLQTYSSRSILWD